MTPTDAIELAREAGEMLAAEYERAAGEGVLGRGERIDAANVRVIGKRDYADWKDRAAIRAILAFANLVEARVKERAAKVCEDMPDVVLEFWDRPGSAPGNGYRPLNRKDIASAIRSME